MEQNGQEKQAASLKAGFTPLSVWAFSIGTSIGWGSFIVTCNTYLQKSGVLGTVFGLLAGMAVILVIAWNLQYMIGNAPDVGGIYTFEKRTSGKDPGFLAFWFILLTYFAILWANITSVPLFARFFLGHTFQFGFHYSVFGYEVWFGEALLSIVSVVLVGFLCAKSGKLPGKIMAVMAVIFAAGFSICAVIALFKHESSFSYAPLYTEGSDAFGQIIRIAAISPWAFIGFENVSHFSEEYTFPVKKIRGILIGSVLFTTVLYLFVSLLSVSAYPPEYESWLAYIRDMGSLEGIQAVPAFYAADHYLGRTGVFILMLSLFGVILTSLIGNLMALSRLLYAAGREGDASARLAALSGDGIPDKAVYAVVIVSAFIPFLGRTAIGWIVDVTTLGATLIYTLLSYAVFLYAKKRQERREKITGILGMVLMGCFVLLLLIPSLLPFDAMETESYVLFIVWSLVGLIYFRQLIRRDKNREYGKSFIVWAVLLLLVLLASTMWVSRVTENAADAAVERIFEYHESHPADDSDEQVREDRIAFLQEQASQISSTNTLYSIVSVGLFLLIVLMMLNNYRDTQRLGEKLTAAEKEAEAARKIAELKGSITTLFDNMPAISFSKDAETGVYMACNQAFADYAGKKDQSEVLGLRDSDFFDPVTAEHFVETDRVAASMDIPYMFFEDVMDAAGNRKQLRTTKLKYIDESGRHCILGMCLDETEMVRIKRESALTKEAYEKARNAGITYTHIAKTLAQGYTDLYYVNLETEEFTEYQAEDEGGELTEKRRGQHFFDTLQEEAGGIVHADDLDAVTQALKRETLLDALKRNNTFMMTYRLLSDHGSFYASMRVSRMTDDERFLVIGVADVDEQMKQQRTMERIKEERIAYARINALTGDFICVYTVVPETGRYREYSSSGGYETFGIAKEGTDFFTASIENGRDLVCPEDMDRFLTAFTRENVLQEIERNGIFTLSYRLMLNGRPSHVQLRAAMVEEKDGHRLVVGINDVDAQVRQEEEYGRRLSQAQTRASVDALTGVKNKHAYLDAEEHLDRLIADNHAPAFAIVILDVNDLKKVNDTAGHKAGDQYLCEACRIICDIFKRSPVFRVGGDEFAVIAQGRDYQYIDELVGEMGDHNEEALSAGGIVIACGMARYENEGSVAPVFERADQIMYENKSWLKERK